MRILLIGSGGREHALAWKLGRSPLCEAIIAAPGNPGIAGEAKVRCIPVAADATAALIEAAVAERVDLVVCGPEAPLAAGLGDAMRAAGLPFFGPSRGAAEIEGSKAYAKRLMRDAGVSYPLFYSVFEPIPQLQAWSGQSSAAALVRAIYDA
jgi:phosphoribosylamine--glycine ligase